MRIKFEPFMEELMKEIGNLKRVTEKCIDKASHYFKSSANTVTNYIHENSYNLARMVATRVKYALPALEASRHEHNPNLQTVIKATSKEVAVNLPKGLINDVMHNAGKLLNAPVIKQALQVTEKISHSFSSFGISTARHLGNLTNNITGKSFFDFDNAPKLKNIFNDAIEEAKSLNISNISKILYKVTSKMGGVFKAAAIGEALYEGTSEKIVSVATSIAIGAGAVAITAAAIAAAPVTLSVSAAGAVIFVAGMAGGMTGGVLGEKIGAMLDHQHLNLKDNGISLKHAESAIMPVISSAYNSLQTYMTDNNRNLPRSTHKVIILGSGIDV